MRAMFLVTSSKNFGPDKTTNRIKNVGDAANGRNRSVMDSTTTNRYGETQSHVPRCLCAESRMDIKCKDWGTPCLLNQPPEKPTRKREMTYEGPPYDKR